MTSSTKIQRKQTSLTVYVVLIEGILKGTHQAKKTARGRLSPAWFENLNINLPEFCNLHSYALFWSRSAWFWIKNAKFEADWPYFFETVRANCKMRVANISYVNIIYSNFHQYIFDADFLTILVRRNFCTIFRNIVQKISTDQNCQKIRFQNPRRKYVGEILNILYSRMKYWLPASYNSPFSKLCGRNISIFQAQKCV